MLSLAMVSFSACSAAISSSTGATILHGPHHSAQKSTSTGLSLPSTSLAKLASVTVTVLPAMVVLPLLVLDIRVCRENRRDRRSMPGSALVEGLGEPALGVDRGGHTGAGRGDGLAVDVVDHVTAGEDAVDVRAGAGVLHLDVPLVVQLELAGEQLAARVVADGHEEPGDGQRLGRAAGQVGQLDTGHGGLAEHLGDLLAQLPPDLLVVLRPL